jgi:hypothetical protein
MNIVSFKKAVIDQLVRDRMKTVSVNHIVEHIAVRNESNSRSTCAFVPFKGQVLEQDLSAKHTLFLYDVLEVVTH